MNFILPILISKLHLQTSSGISFKTLLWPILAEIPAAYLSSIMIETKTFGRKYLLMFSFIATGILLIIITFYHSNFTILVSAARFLLVTAFSVKYAYTSEVYPTEFRSTAVGTASSFGRLGGIFMPWICTLLFSYGDFMPYIGLATVAIIGGFAASSLPYDTYKRELDQKLIEY